MPKVRSGHCPHCGGDLVYGEDGWKCLQCSRTEPKEIDSYLQEIIDKIKRKANDN